MNKMDEIYPHIMEWARTLHDRYKGERNMVRSCDTLQEVSETWASVSLGNVLRERGLKLSRKQVAALTWVCAFHQEYDKETEDTFAEMAAKSGKITKDRFEDLMSSSDRGEFVRQLLGCVKIVKRKIPVHVLEDIVYYGSSVKIRWKTDFCKHHPYFKGLQDL